MISEMQKMFAAGAITYGALFTAMVFGSALALGNYIAVFAAILSAGISYLTYFVSFAHCQATEEPKPRWIAIAYPVLSLASIAAAIVASATLLWSTP